MVLGAAGAAKGATPFLVTAIVALGAAYGLLLVTGLADVVRTADPRTLGGMVARYYAVAYLGIAAPYIIAVLAVPLGYPRVLAGTGAAAGMSLAGNLAYRLRLSSRKEVCA
jgi:dipeptide/tripeptide permease